MALQPTQPSAPTSLVPPHRRFSAIPDATGMYDPANEKDACGLAMVATDRKSVV